MPVQVHWILDPKNNEYRRRLVYYSSTCGSAYVVVADFFTYKYRKRFPLSDGIKKYTIGSIL